MKALITILLFATLWHTVAAQAGVYRLSSKSGASCTIAVTKENTNINADIFAWWHTVSCRHGTFAGEGALKNNTCLLKGNADADCLVSLTFGPGKLQVKFNDCMNSNLPDDFSGTYQKITGHLPGVYRVVTTKACFYKTADTGTRLRTYLLKGDKVSVELENITDDQWVFINYTNGAGKITSGYLLWAALK